MSTATTPDATEQPRVNAIIHGILTGSALRNVLGIVLGFFVGSLFMVFSNETVLFTLTYVFARPADFLGASATVIANAAEAIWRGAVFNADAGDFAGGIRPFTESLRLAAPLIAAGLGIALGFRVGLFNIGGTGQLIFGAAIAAWVSFRIPMPWGIHLLVAIVVGVSAAALWGSIAGFLKARTGAHEVIVTIMLNYVALNFFTWLLRTPELLLEANGGGTPKSDPPADTAMLPTLFGDMYKIHIGIFFAIAAAFIYWLLMDRSAIGYRFKMVGHNMSAARAAGIKVESTFIWAMAVSAAFAGLAAANQALSETGGITTSINANIGFDAITVALLGGNSAKGIFAAGLLFGAFKAGSPAMQVAGVSPEILGVVQALIVLFIAAPPLIKAFFRLPQAEVK